MTMTKQIDISTAHGFSFSRRKRNVPLSINPERAKGVERVEFTKMAASGNDFIIVNAASCRMQAASLGNFARKICDRKYGVGADGLLLLEKSKIADIKMRIFNADGSEAEMCGNGARCIAAWLAAQKKRKSFGQYTIETKAGLITSAARGDNVKIKLTDPKDMKLSITLEINGRPLRANFINTGVPHTVIFVEGLDLVDVETLGRTLRNHAFFKPRGTNVNFVEIVNDNFIKVRTYERGVEAETLACGTGVVASALIASRTLKTSGNAQVMAVLTRSKETLKVYFNRNNDNVSDVWLEGKAHVVFTGQCAVKGGGA